MKKILILGGTKFIGRNLIEKLISTNRFELTLFNRQKSNSNLFPKLKKIKGDRETDDVQQIAKESWDFVIDLSCYLPYTLSSVLEQLKPSLEKYIFISTCSVYNNKANHSELRSEDAPLHDCTEEQAKEKTLKFYGKKKVACERILAKSGFNHVVLRPALVFGTHDYTDRFYYWLYQVRQKDSILLAEYGEHKFSITYIDDLVNSILQLLDAPSPSTIYNIISQPQMSIGQIVSTASQLLDRSPNIISAPADFLKEQKVSQWMDMPLWINGNYFTYSNQLILEELKLPVTNFEEATKATIGYYDVRGWAVPEYGMSEERKEELIGLLG